MTTQTKDLITASLFIIVTFSLFFYVVSNLSDSKQVTHKAIIELHNLR